MKKRRPNGGSYSLKCPHCGHFETKTLDSRPSARYCRRCRECLKCKERFTTAEIVIVTEEGVGVALHGRKNVALIAVGRNDVERLVESMRSGATALCELLNNDILRRDEP